MKKYTALALLLTAALTLSACGTEDKAQPENSSGTTSSTTTGNTPEESSGENSEEITEQQPPEVALDEDVLALIQQFDVDSFTAPDGTEVMLTEAVSQMNDFALYFDFAYIRYAFPIYSDTVTDPEIYDFEEFEYKMENYTGERPDYFRVKKGDVLDNGMTVTEANYFITPGNTQHPFENSAVLEGECTLEGVLYRCPEDDYMIAQDDVVFYPNPIDGAVPDPYNPYGYDNFGELYLLRGVDLYSEFAFITDGGAFSLGNINDMDSYVKDLFGDSSYIRVKVTLDGMRLRYSDNFGIQGWSTLKNAELLDS